MATTVDEQPGPSSRTILRPEPGPHSAADRFMRRLLRIPDHPRGGRRRAERAFQTSMVISGTRCLFTYVIFPFVAPALGVATGVGPALGIIIGVVALVADVFSVRRFWLADHKWKWHFTIIVTAVMVLLWILLVQDITELLR